jgi:hypothetical protein
LNEELMAVKAELQGKVAELEKGIIEDIAQIFSR